MKIYLAGPMTSIPFFNAPTFDRVTAAFRSRGYTVFSPVEVTRALCGADFFERNPTGDPALAADFNLREAMAENLRFICQGADALALLPGWENSKGTAVEIAIAKLLGLPQYPIEELLQ